MKSRFETVFAILAVLALAATPARADPVIYDYEVVAEYPHDPGAFTQGLFFKDGDLYEATGQYGESSLRLIELETGDVTRLREFPDDIFAEGVAPWNGRIVALSWKNGTGFVFDRETFEPQAEFTYDGEGWGLTEDGERLIMSDGTSDLRFLDPATFEETGRVSVSYQGRPLGDINELEWIDGALFANIWRTDVIARIDAGSGEVTGLVDMRGLRDRFTPREGPRAEVLNGIAYDAENERIFVTGKYWPKLFEVRLIERAAP